VDARALSACAAPPHITIVMLTHNRRDTVCASVERLRRSDPDVPIVVVDNGSSDGTTHALCTRFPEIIVVRLRTNVGAAARNAGLRITESPYVALSDDDTWWAPGALASAAAVLDGWPDVAIVTGRVVVGDRARPDSACIAMARSPLWTPPGAPGRCVLGFLAGASVVRREACLAAGGFEPRFFLGGEEQLLALDLVTAGWWILYAPHVVVHHHPSPLRDAASRRRLLLRNALWSAWLRRRAGSAVARTVDLLRGSPRDASTALALAEAVAGVPWVLWHRRVLPATIDEALRRVEGAEARRQPRRVATPTKHIPQVRRSSWARRPT